MIRISDPTRVGPALGQVRELRGIRRRHLAHRIALKTFRTVTSVNSQLWQWEMGHHAPDLASLGPVLDALGYDLALIPREEA